MNFDTLTGRKHSKLTEYEGHFIHKDILSSFIELQRAAKKDINAELKIVSSFRDYERQRLIWNSKALGKRKLLNDEGEEINFGGLTQEQLLSAILRFSAIPGASRHHWGTDFDIYDASQISKEDLQLTHQECVGSGPCAKLHTWLDNYLLNTDFYRPYEFDQGGVSIEKWHLSFRPISDEFLKAYTYEIFQKNIHKSDIELKEELLKSLEYYYKQFFLNLPQ